MAEILFFLQKNEIYTYGIDQSEIAINNLKKYEKINF